PTLMVSKEVSTFINRIEYSPFYPRWRHNDAPDKASLLAADFKKLYRTERLPLMYNIIQFRDLSNNFIQPLAESVLLKLTVDFVRTVDIPIFNKEIERLYSLRERKKTGYTLPNTAAANIFKKLINAHKGKIL